MDILRTDIKLLIPVCSEASAKAHAIAIAEAKKYPDNFHQIYLTIYNQEFILLYTSLLKQFG